MMGGYSGDEEKKVQGESEVSGLSSISDACTIHLIRKPERTRFESGSRHVEFKVPLRWQ